MHEIVPKRFHINTKVSLIFKGCIIIRL